MRPTSALRALRRASSGQGVVGGAGMPKAFRPRRNFFSRLGAAWRVYRAPALIALREKLVWRGNLFGSMLTYGLFVFIFSRIWATVYAGRGMIAGYDRVMCVWYFAIAEVVAYGFGRFYWALDREIKNGQIAYLISRPCDLPLFRYAQAMGNALPDALVFLVEGTLIAVILAGPLPQAQVLSIPFLLTSLFLGGSLSFFLHFSIAMSAFWLEENAAFFWVFQKITLVTGTLIPLEFLPQAARRVLRWTPFPSMVYAPARIAAAFSPREAAELLLAQALWLSLAFALAKFLYAQGLRRVSINGG